MPDIINPEEQESLRAEVEKWYDDVCDIRRRTRSSDAFGGESETDTVVATGVICDISAQVQAMRPTDVLASQIEIRQLYTVSMPAGTDVKFHDRLVITSWTPNQEMVVQSVLTPESWEMERQCVCSLEGEPIV